MDIHVSNLNSTITEEDLRELFIEHGVVGSVKIIKEHYTGQSKGFAFIIMPNEEEALTAISSLNNFQIGHRALGVSKAKPRTTYRVI